MGQFRYVFTFSEGYKVKCLALLEYGSWKLNACSNFVIWCIPDILQQAHILMKAANLFDVIIFIKIARNISQ